MPAQEFLRRAGQGIAGIKHAAGGIDSDTVMLMADLPDRFALLGGGDVFAAAAAAA